MSLMEKLKQRRLELEAKQQEDAVNKEHKTLEDKIPSLAKTENAKETNISDSNEKEEPKDAEQEPAAEETKSEEVVHELNETVPSEDKDFNTLEKVKTESEEESEDKKETDEEHHEEKKRRGRPKKSESDKEEKEESSEEEIKEPEPTTEILSAIEEEIKEENVEEEQKETKKTKKTSKKHEVVEQISYVSIDVLGDKINVDEATANYLNYFFDEGWKEKEEYFLNKVTEIRIEADMNPGTLKFTLADLCALNDEIMPHYLEQKKIYDSLVNKDFGSATAFKIANSTGSNAEERKRSGFLSLMKAKINGQEINYITLINAIQMRYTALYEIMKMIKYKSDICITMASAIKTEMQLVNG